MELIDISMKIEEDMIYYPGNPEPEIEQYRQIPEDSTTESEIDIGSHTGTHVDAPQHVFEDGETIAEMELESFYGECRVVDLTESGKAIEREDLEEKEIDAEIVLLKTENSEKHYREFREDFAHLTLEGVQYLIQQGVKTVGIDYLSLVAFEDDENAEEAHQVANRKMAVFEGLNLREVEPGKYVFSGFPLKMDTDGAPARAVLIEQ